MSATGNRVTESFRVRPAAFVGPLAVAAIVAAIGCVLWAFGVPHAAPIGLAVGLLLALIVLVLLLRRPRLVELDADGVRVRGGRLAWGEIGTVHEVRTEHGVVLEISATEGDRESLLVPMRWLAPTDVDRLRTQLVERANTAAGYRHVSTAPVEQAEQTEQTSDVTDEDVHGGSGEVAAPQTRSSGWSMTGRAGRAGGTVETPETAADSD